MGQKPKLKCDACGKSKKKNSKTGRWVCQPCKGKKLKEWRRNKSAATPKKGRAKKGTYHKWITTIRYEDGKKKSICKKCYKFAEIATNRNICVDCHKYERSTANPTVMNSEWRKKRNAQNLESKRRREQDPVYRERELAAYREKQLKKLYNLDNKTYNKLGEAQAWLCAICNKPETAVRAGYPLKLSVDHDHSTKIVRGLLCHKCNRGLGLFQDSPELLQKAITYLIKQENLNT